MVLLGSVAVGATRADGPDDVPVAPVRRMLAWLVLLAPLVAHADDLPERTPPAPPAAAPEPHLRAEPFRAVPAPERPAPAALDDETVQAVVLRERPGLSRCWDPDATTARVLVRVHASVGPSGDVTSADVSGAAPNALRTCIAARVTRWRFPRTAGGVAEFPVVFSGP